MLSMCRLSVGGAALALPSCYCADNLFYGLAMLSSYGRFIAISHTTNLHAKYASKENRSTVDLKIPFIKGMKSIKKPPNPPQVGMRLVSAHPADSLLYVPASTPRPTRHGLPGLAHKAPAPARHGRTVRRAVLDALAHDRAPTGAVELRCSARRRTGAVGPVVAVDPVVGVQALVALRRCLMRVADVGCCPQELSAICAGHGALLVHEYSCAGCGCWAFSSYGSWQSWR